MFRLFECCALSFFERFVLSFSLKIERFVSDSAEIWICGLYKHFTEKGIRTNCTLVFSVGQALLAAKAGATYVSPFVGRLDDICEDGVRLVGDIVRMYRTYDYKTQVLAASIRNTKHIIECVEVGADVATCPLSAIKGLLNHPLTDSGLKKFLEDYKKVNG